ncbi:MAG: flagellar biosynthetic protein FliO [Alphaproteobacteria bacterium]
MDTVDIGLGDYIKFILALIFVLALIGSVTLIARRMGFGMPAYKGLLADRRLSIVETLNIDGKRRLLLVRRDDTEHLVLLGSTEDLLIEGGVPAPENAFSRSLQAAAKAAERQDDKAIETTDKDTP